MVAGWIQHIFRIYTTVFLVPMSMYSNISHFADLQIYSHTKKGLSGRQQHQLKSSWPLSGLPWHTQHRGLLLMEYAAVFPTWELLLVYCMCFTVMEPCYLYRKSKTRYHRSNWHIHPVSWVSLDSKTRGLKLILFKVISGLEIVFFINGSELILFAVG